MIDEKITALLEHADLWCAGRMQDHGGSTVPSGIGALDPVLPGGGWPRGALTEILFDRDGSGELGLVMPALAALSRQGRWIAWVAPPYIPYAPALAALGMDLSRNLLIHPREQDDALWAVAQALRSGTCGAVLAWPRLCSEQALRRLQLAAEAGHCLGLLFRPASARHRPSPAALRVQLGSEGAERGAAAATRLQIHKRRGGGPVDLSLAACQGDLFAPEPGKGPR